MAQRKTSEHSKAKTMLRLPDLEQSKNAVLHSPAAASSRESYGHAIDEFIRWYCSEPRLAFNEPSSFATGLSFANQVSDYPVLLADLEIFCS
jgi:hypothetical protein